MMAQVSPRLSGSPLAVPLTRVQVEAAGTLRRRLGGWQRVDSALCQLQQRFPLNTELSHVLPKAIGLNSLHTAGLSAVRPMAAHIVDVMVGKPDSPPARLVTEIALVPGLHGHYVSFASKYCHFFVDRSRFPIFDTFTSSALVLHAGPLHSADYQAYLEAVDRLRQSADGCSYAELDHYLWLRGQLIAYQQGRHAFLNGEVRQLFEKPAGDADVLLAQVFPVR